MSLRLPRGFSRATRLAALVVLALLLSLNGPQKSSAVPVVAGVEKIPVRIEGPIIEITPDVWTIDKFLVQVYVHTTIDERKGAAEVGAWVIVVAIHNGASTLEGELIQVERPAPVHGPTNDYTGIVTKRSPQEYPSGNWVVGSNLFLVDEATRGNLDVVEGDLVRISAEQQAQVLHAVVVQKLAGATQSMPVEFEGTIESMDGENWVIDGSHVQVPGTAVLGDPAVGKAVEVQADLDDAGLLHARIVRIMDEPLAQMFGGLLLSAPAAQEAASSWTVLVFSDSLDAAPAAAQVEIPAGVFVDEERASLKEMQWLEIRAVPAAGGAYKAEFVRVEAPLPVKLQGLARQESVPTDVSSGSWWQLEGKPVWVSSATGGLARLDGVNDVVVDGLLLGNGVIWAERITPTGQAG